MSFFHSKLPNGINFISYDMPYLNSITINVVVNVGSRFESEAEQGISHFLEHMAFKGTKKRSAMQIAQEFDEIGGYFNAYTSREQTVYHTKTLAEHTSKALEILADILQNSQFATAEINKERQVIIQEMAACLDSSDDLAYEQLYQLAYPDQPLGRSILGTSAHLEQFSKKDFLNFISKHYTTDNIVIAAAGKIDHQQIEQLIIQLFDKFAMSSIRQVTAAKYRGGCSFISKALEQTTLVLGFESPAYTELAPFYQAQIMSVILGGGISSRLFQKIREELGLAYSIASGAVAFEDSGLFNIYAATDHQQASNLLDILQLELADIQTEVTPSELERAKAHITANLLLADESATYKSEELGRNFAIFGRYFPTSEIIDIVQDTKTSDITTVAEQIFSSTASISIVGDQKAARLADQAYKAYKLD